MRNKDKQVGTIALALVLTVALVLGLIGLAKKLQDAHIKSIQGTIEQQFNQER